jgi:hypothetical protein
VFSVRKTRERERERERETEEREEEQKWSMKEIKRFIGLNERATGLASVLQSDLKSSVHRRVSSEFFAKSLATSIASR